METLFEKSIKPESQNSLFLRFAFLNIGTMENIQSNLLNIKVSNNLRLTLTYFSILLFFGLVSFVSLSVNNYVNDTMSIGIAQPEAIKIAEEVSEETTIIVKVKRGDTLQGILAGQSLPNNHISQIIKLVEEHQGNSALQIGQQITFDYEIKIVEEGEEDLASESRSLNKMVISLDKLKSIEITKEQDNFVAKTTTILLNKFIAKSEAVINSSLMSALRSLGLSTNSIVELINSYSYQVDFQRQIQTGDKVTVISEKFTTEDGKFSHNGKILYASLNLSGVDYNIYRYSPDNSNNHSFFSEDGKSVKRSLLRTPVKIARVSSHYGNRKHPTLGFTKMHRGVDFAAPSGTPIYAAGDGVITDMGLKSTYGKFIQIKHSASLSTAYAHASSFAKNISVGTRVKQGDVIAYVGKTGRTSGDHLHFEVKINGQHVNPMSIKTTPGIELKGKELAKFHQFKNKVRSLKVKLDDNVEIAENSASFSN